MASRTFVVFVGLAAALAGADMPKPRYAADGALVRPEGYREWMFVGSNLNMGYVEGAPPAEDRFHNIFIQREAYQQFARTGTFPDKTMLVMEVFRAGGNASINKRGKFEDEFLGIEVALKDESKLAEKWGYFNFIGGDGKPLAQSKPFAKDKCWSCHNQHGQVDNVFAQFYPVLRAARPK
jgi:cytochrome P460